MRRRLRTEVESIEPFDNLEIEHKADVLAWIDSGAELYRRAKPATPPKHLVAYFVVVDGDHVLLVDHKNAQLWLPTGGHVEAEEHPTDAVRRELWEELQLEAVFLTRAPILVTVADTVGLTAGHSDVTLWYALQGNRKAPVVYDPDEFHGAKWFTFDAMPLAGDPNMGRFVGKLKSKFLPT